MLVKCKKYSVTYPTGPQKVGDVIELTKLQAEYYEQLGWVKILPCHLQPKGDKGKLIISKDRPAMDLSKNKKVFRGERIKKLEIKEKGGIRVE